MKNVTTDLLIQEEQKFSQQEKQFNENLEFLYLYKHDIINYEAKEEKASNETNNVIVINIY